ncbi:MAG: hypothetical protein JW726_15055 [Anaerolineales bacterium]|nr:hypothetical protein [Anaerolineales bacterium]
MQLGTFADYCLDMLGDGSSAVWARATVMQWVNEAIRDFPIGKPTDTVITCTAGTYAYDLPAGFREITKVEYPTSQDPPEYLVRKSHQDPDFWADDIYYDVDRDYTSESGHQLWISADAATGATVNVNYLADHTSTLTEYSTITVPDQYLGVLMLHVRKTAYAERLAYQIGTPTAHTSTIQQTSNAYQQAKSEYEKAVELMLAALAESRQTPLWKMDKYDRTY